MAQWIAVAVFVAVVRHNGWVFYQGGDETFFYTSSWVLAHGHIPNASIGYGWSLLLSPIARAIGPNYLAALPALVLFQTLVLLPLVPLCVYGIARRIGGRVFGFVTAALWISVPFCAIPLWDQTYHPKYVEQFLPQAFGLTGLGDFPSMLCLLVAALFCMRALDTEDSVDWVVAGVAAGFAIGIKPANSLFLAGPALAFVAARRFREARGFALALLPSLVALTLWKYRGLGYVPIFRTAESFTGRGRVETAAVLPIPAGLHRYLHLDWSQLRRNYVDLRGLFWGAPLWQGLPILGFIGVARRSSAKALLLGGWAGAFLIVKGSSDVASLDSGTLLRLFMPGFPPLFILAVLAPLFVLGSRIRESPAPRESARINGRVVAVVVAVFAVAPLLFFIAIPPLRARTAATYAHEDVMLPVDGSFTVVLRRGVGGELVSWKAPASPGVGIFYRVFRSRPVAAAPEATLPPGYDGIRCEKGRITGYAGTTKCWFEMSVVGKTRALHFLDKPLAGPWVYRVGLAANWRNDPSGGDVLVLSEPARLIASR